MPEGTSIAKAYVQIVPSMQGVKGTLEKEMDGIGEESGKKGGSSAGASFAKAMGSALAVGAAAVTAAVVKIGTQAIKSYAEYEQLVGGVETLFGESADQIADYAANAYKTAGISANEYMEQSTSFAAALLQGLDGDTAKAAKYADTAITDMADNANKMGTSLEAIQNAYQGFAKANYTMLDNLKLGYGGTQSEMIRLINDSGILNEEISSMDGITFDQIVEAIHAVQTEMGISGLTAEEAAEAVKNGTMTEEEAFEALGTTAKEASTTILGSVGAMKSAWSNLLTGVADENADFDTLMQNFVDSVVTVGENLLPRIKTTLDGVALLVDGLVTQLLPQIIEQIPGLIESLLPVVLNGVSTIVTSISTTLPELLTVALSALPQIAQLGLDLIIQLANGISTALPTLIPTIVQVVLELVNILIQNLPLILQAGVDILMALIQGIIASLPILIEQLPVIVTTIVNTLLESIDVIMEAGVTLLTALIDAIPQMLPLLTEALPNIIETVITGLYEGLPLVLEGAISMFTAIVDAIPTIVESLASALPQIIVAIIAALINSIPTILQSAIQCLIAIVQAIPTIVQMLIVNLPQIIKTIITSLIQAAPQILTSAKQALSQIGAAIPPLATQLWNSMKTVGLQLIQGLWNGISNAAAWIYSQISGFFSSVLSYIKGLFGIASPSKEMAWMGKMLDYGLAGGIEDNMKPIQRAIDDVTDMTTGTLQDNLAVNAALGVSTDAQATSKLDQLIATVAALGDKMASMQLVMDSGALVGATTTKYNQALGFDQALVARGVAR